MKVLSLLLGLLLLAGCHSQQSSEVSKSEETKQYNQDSEFQEHEKCLLSCTKIYADFSKQDFKELAEIWSYRLDLNQVTSHNAFQVYIGSETIVGDPSEEKCYLASLSPYPVENPTANYSLDVREKLLDLQKTGDIEPGKLPIVLVPTPLRDGELIGRITVVSATLRRVEKP